MTVTDPILDLTDWPDTLRELVARGRIHRYRKGTLLIQEGDLGDTLFIILAGRLRAFSVGDRDREITYGVYGRGEYLGSRISRSRRPRAIAWCPNG